MSILLGYFVAVVITIAFAKKSALNKREYYGTGGSRIHRSRPQATEDEDDDKSHGDEAHLTIFHG